MKSATALQTRLASVVGQHRVAMEPHQTGAFTLGMKAPGAVVWPETVAQAAEIVTLAGCERLALVPWGQGTQMHLGQAPQQYDLALALTDLAQIVEYDHANLTLVAQAGVSLNTIYALSVPERQFLPLGFPGTKASLGGLLVTNTSGVKRARYGAVRDVLLGVRVAMPEGALVHFGGRVVKNVAGYDMNKLFIGSLGAFGVILETTYRLAALPEEDRAALAVFPAFPQALTAAAAVQRSPLLPSALVLLDATACQTCPVAFGAAVTPPQVALMLNFDGMHEAVARQMRDSMALCRQHGALSVGGLAGEDLLAFWEFWEAWRAAPGPTEPARLQLRLGVDMRRIVEVMAWLARPEFGDTSPGGWLFEYHSNQLWTHVPLAPSPPATLAQDPGGWLGQLRQQVRAAQGYCVVEYAPPAIHRQFDVWGETPGQQLLQRYKQRFDPHAILNPGRYIAGL